MQFLWLNMIKTFLEKNKSVVSVPYRGMILIISSNSGGSEFIRSTEFKEIMNDVLEFKEGRDRNANYFIADLTSIPQMAKRPGVISDKFPIWLPNELKGEYSFMIMINTSKIFEHVKYILKKNRIDCKSDLEDFHKSFIIHLDKGVIDCDFIIGTWLLSGVTIDAIGPIVDFYIKHRKEKHNGELIYNSGKFPCDERIKNFADENSAL